MSGRVCHFRSPALELVDIRAAGLISGRRKWVVIEQMRWTILFIRNVPRRADIQDIPVKTYSQQMLAYYDATSFCRTMPLPYGAIVWFERGDKLGNKVC